VGLFSKKQEEVRCGACNAMVLPSERPHIHADVTRITETEPSWLPAPLRAEAPGEYTFRCGWCNSFPSMKWPSQGGAHSGMMLHLGAAHQVGMFASRSSMPQGFSEMQMIAIRSTPEAAPSARNEPVVIDMSKARDAVFALAYAPSSNDAQVRAAVSNMVHLSGQPPLEQIVETVRSDRDIFQQPWKWLAAVIWNAGDTGDYHLAAAGLYWSCHWMSILVPKLGNDLMAYAELELGPISLELRKKICAVGIAATQELPEDFVIVGDGTGKILAGWLVKVAPSALVP
jgi:hypothetical protein